MSNSNYGVDILTKEKMEEIIHGLDYNSGYFGPIIEDNGKYYITTLKEGIDKLEFYDERFELDNPNDPNYDYTKYYEVTKVINKSTTIEEAEKIINDNNYEYSKPNYKIEDVNNYVNEVEKTLKEEVGHVNINNDGSVDIYDLDGNEIVKGTKITLNSDTNSSNKYDLSDIEKVVKPKETYTVNTKLDDNNKIVIENYIKDITGYDVKIEEQEGFYVANVNGKVIVFDKDETLGKAINTVNEEFKNEKSIKNPNKSLATNRMQQEANSQRIYIDVASFESVLSTYDSASKLVDEGKSKYKTEDLTGRLKEAYVSLVSEQSPVTKLEKTSDLISIIIKNINYSLKAYENIDHNLGVIINSIISEIFSINNYKDEETKEFYESSLQEREKNITNIIENLEKSLDKLKDDYNKKYSNDSVWFSENITSLLMGVGNAFGLFEDNDYYTKGNSNGQLGMPISSFLKTTEFILNNDLITKLKSYSDGASWKDSGLNDVHESLKQGTTINEKVAENNFLDHYLVYQSDSSFREMKLKGAGTQGSTYGYSYNDNEIKLIKSHMQTQIKDFGSMTESVNNLETGEKETLTGVDLLKYYTDDIHSYEEAISATASQVYNYKQYQLIMPYEADMQGDKYLEYLVKDYGSVDIYNECPELMGNIQYMSQKEIALYMMYKGSRTNQDKALGYLSAMEDIINQRHGLEDAILRIKDYNDWAQNGGIGGINAFLKSGVDGFSDGIEGFFAGIGNVLAADGKRSARDYRNMYMLSLLSDNSQSSNVDEMCKLLGVDNMDSTFKSVLRRNYTILKSVGNIAIPTIAGFIPGAGPIASKVLFGLNTLGSSTEAAMQYQMQTSGETDAGRAYLYGGISALSQVAMNKISGIAGLNGNVSVPSSATEFLLSMAKQGGRATAGVYTDAILRASILGQPVDINSLPADGLDAAITGALTAGLMNGITTLSLKIADGFVFKFSDKYNSYSEMQMDMQRQFNESKLGQKLAILKSVGGKKWEQEKLKYDKTIVKKWLKEQGDSNKYGITDYTYEADSILGSTIKLQDGQRLIFDPARSNYYIYDINSGSALALPTSFLNTREGGMHIIPTAEEQILLNYKQGRYGDFANFIKNNPNIRDVQTLSDGNIKIITKFGQPIIVSKHEFDSYETYLKILESNTNMEDMLDDTTISMLDDKGQNFDTNMFLDFIERNDHLRNGFSLPTDKYIQGDETSGNMVILKSLINTLTSKGLTTLAKDLRSATDVGYDFDLWQFLNKQFNRGTLTSQDLNTLSNLPKVLPLLSKSTSSLDINESLKALKENCDIYNAQSNLIARLLVRNNDFRKQYYSSLYETTKAISKENAVQYDYYLQFPDRTMILGDGTKVRLLGSDEEILQKELAIYTSSHSKLDPVIASAVKEVYLYDGPDPEELVSILEAVGRMDVNDERIDEMKLGGGYIPLSQRLRFNINSFDNSTNIDVVNNHEHLHAIDHKLGMTSPEYEESRSTSDKMLYTFLTDSWKTAQKQDGNNVTEYGTWNWAEDFAETGGIYEVLKREGSVVYEGKTYTLEEFEQKYPNRIRVYNELIEQYKATQ